MLIHSYSARPIAIGWSPQRFVPTENQDTFTASVPLSDEQRFRQAGAEYRKTQGNSGPSAQEIRLSSGGTIQTTPDRLQAAQRLAAKITFQVKASGAQEKVSNPVILKKVSERLAAFSVEDLKLLEKDGFRILLVDSAQKPKGGYPGGRPGIELNEDGSWKDWVGGYNAMDSKTIIMPLAHLDREGSTGDILVHELAHALADSRVPDKKRLFGKNVEMRLDDESGPVGKAYLNYAKRCGYSFVNGKSVILFPDKVWNGYALRNPLEYWAVGVTVYKQGGERKENLRRLDPDFFNLLRRSFPNE